MLLLCVVSNFYFLVAFTLVLLVSCISVFTSDHNHEQLTTHSVRREFIIILVVSGVVTAIVDNDVIVAVVAVLVVVIGNMLC